MYIAWGQGLTFQLQVSCIHAVPANPMFDVCAVYSMVNGSLQTVESTWNEVVCKVLFILLSKYCMLLCWISRFIATQGMQYSPRLQAEWNINTLRVVINLISNLMKVQYLFYYTHYACI